MLHPNRCAAMAWASIDAVEEVARRRAVEALLMLPLGAARLVSGIAGNVEQSRLPQAAQFAVDWCVQAERRDALRRVAEFYEAHIERARAGA